MQEMESNKKVRGSETKAAMGVIFGLCCQMT